MLKRTTVLQKNPWVLKQGQGKFTDQLKRLLQKKHLHYYKWDPLPMYEPRRLVHADRILCQRTGMALHDPFRAENQYHVPDQKYLKVPVPREYKDAYWWRELQARRVQCPVEWVGHKIYRSTYRFRTDFQDMSMREKFRFSADDILEQATRGGY